MFPGKQHNVSCTLSGSVAKLDYSILVLAVLYDWKHFERGEGRGRGEGMRGGMRVRGEERREMSLQTIPDCIMPSFLLQFCPFVLYSSAGRISTDECLPFVESVSFIAGFIFR